MMYKVAKVSRMMYKVLRVFSRASAGPQSLQQGLRRNSEARREKEYPAIRRLVARPKDCGEMRGIEGTANQRLIYIIHNTTWMMPPNSPTAQQLVDGECGTLAT